MQQPSASAVTKYRPTLQEVQAACRIEQSRKSHSRFVHGKVGDITTPILNHPNAYYGLVSVIDAIGVDDYDVFAGLLAQIMPICFVNGKVDIEKLNFVVSFLKAEKPKDTVQLMLKTQMATVHVAQMESARRFIQANDIRQRDSAERALNKLSRTFSMQMEADRRHKNGGQQTIQVQYVTVKGGGQAIVGNVAPGGRDDAKG